MAILSVKNLVTSLHQGSQRTDIVRDVSFDIEPGQIVGVVGESGSGKSMMAYSLIDLLPRHITVQQGQVLYQNTDLTHTSHKHLRSLRGSRIAMIFQDPMMSLNPVLTIGEQLIETVLAHQSISKHGALQRAISVLRRVGIPSPESRMRAYPHEFSGGMRQRVVIAMAFLHTPDIIIADEATTALDVTIQSQIIAEIQSLAAESQTAILWITHDLSLLSGFADAVMVMYAGQLVEIGSSEAIFHHPRHPYTAALMASVPTAERTRLTTLPGLPPKLSDLPAGCSFATRCPYVQEHCTSHRPELSGNDQKARCFYPLGGPA